MVLYELFRLEESDIEELCQMLRESNYTKNEFASKYFKEQSKNRQEYLLFELLK